VKNDDGSLFVVVDAPIRHLGEDEGLAVDVGGGNLVSIGQLTKKFIATECPALAGKPKVFLFIEQNTKEDECNKDSAQSAAFRHVI